MTPRIAMGAAVALAATLIAPIALLLIIAGATGGSDLATAASCTGPITAIGAPRGLDDAAQRRNAMLVIAEGRRLNVPVRGLQVAIATAMQESRLHADLDESQSDRDSAGLFQQRRPWGSLAERMDPTTSAGMFFTGGRGGQPGLLDISNWQGMSLAGAAQAVQRSAYPLAYAKWEPLAVNVVADALGGTAPAAAAACTPQAPVASDCSLVTAVQPITATVMVRGFRVHRCLERAVTALLIQASRDGITLSCVSCWRDTQSQIGLRRAHCHSGRGDHYDIWEMPSGRCSPPTAIPGQSQHERGLALDLADSSGTLTRGSPGYSWMAANAGRYGFRNLPSESWHWSTTGR